MDNAVAHFRYRRVECPTSVGGLRMPVYRYKAVDNAGRPVDGRLEADNAKDAVRHLEDRDLDVSGVEEVKSETKAGGRRLSWEDIDLLNNQLEAVVRSGLPLSQGIREIAHELPRRRLHALLDDIHQSIEQGSSLEEAFTRHEGKLPAAYLSMIRAGERTGNLPAVLHLLTAQSNHALEVRSAIAQTLAYPIIVIVACALTLIFQCIYVVPVYKEMFQDFGVVYRNWRITILYSIGDAFTTYLPITLGAIALSGVVVYILCYFARRSPGLMLMWDRTQLRMPLIGTSLRTSLIARFSRALTLLLKSGVPLVESIDLASAATGNRAFRSEGMKAATKVAQGTPVSDALADTGLFNHSFNWLMGNAEQRGDLSETLGNIAESYDRRSRRSGYAVRAIIGPVLICAVALLVLLVFITLYAPIFSLADSLSG